MTCIVIGCPNPIVRVMEHKDDPRVKFALCQFHAGTLIRYACDEQVREFVFGQDGGRG